MRNNEIIEKVKNTLIKAASTFREDQKATYIRAIQSETSPQSKWTMENIMKNAEVAEKNKSPLCDDTGIPHLFLELGPEKSIDGQFLSDIQEGILSGLRALPGRPMAILGDDTARLDQSGGLSADPGMLIPAPIMIKDVEEDVRRLHILMQGGGPEIRANTYRVFHHHKLSVITDTIVQWAKDGTGILGCTPSTLAIGIGRSHYEASSLMIQAMVFGDYNIQSELEQSITDKVNESGIGPLGLGGTTTSLATFLKVGPQRASGVRIVCLRPCCCFEPRVAHVNL